MSNGDVHIVTDLGAIINPDNIKPGIDLKELEQRMISGGLLQPSSRDPQDKLNDELHDEAKKFGIRFGSDPPEKNKDITSKLPSMHNTITQPAQTAHYDSYSDSSDEDDGADSADNNPPSSHDALAPQFTNRFASNQPRLGSDLRSRTDEQERRNHIDSVMGSTDVSEQSTFSFEREKREDMKCAMLAEIDSLMSILSDEDIDLARVPRVTRDSEHDEIESVLKVLRHKNDHTRYCSFAEEFLLFGAYALEELFDGERTWFGRYQPDLTGWHNHLNVKLKRMRHDTGQLVSGVMQGYNIGSGARVLLELIPNMVLYSKLRSQQHSKPSLFSEEEMSYAAQNIRNLD